MGECIFTRKIALVNVALEWPWSSGRPHLEKCQNGTGGRVLDNLQLNSSLTHYSRLINSQYFFVDRSPTSLQSSAIPSNRETSICLLLSRLGTTRSSSCPSVIS